MNTRTKGSAVSNLLAVNSEGKNTSLGLFAYNNPQLASALSMLLTPSKPASFDRAGNRMVEKPNVSDLRLIAAETGKTSDNAEAVMRLFSDVKTASEILVSSVRSPNDMFSRTINFELKDNLHVTPLGPKLLPFVRSYSTDVYPIGKKLDNILRECLFGAGSFPVFVLPENALSDIIQGKASVSAESIRSDTSLNKHTGILGNGAGVSQGFGAESAGLLNKRVSAAYSASINLPAVAGVEGSKSDMVTFIDNPNVLGTGLALEIASKQAINRISRESIGSSNTLSDRELSTLVYRNVTGRTADFLKVKSDDELKRYSVSRPLIIELPPESVVPIVHRGSPDKPIGFIVVLDDNNMPVSRAYNSEEFNALRASVVNDGSAISNNDMTSYMLQRAMRSFNTTCQKLTSEQLTEIAVQLTEADFAARLKNGAMGTSEVSISDNHRLAEMMLYRLFKKQKTKLLFVPSNYITYFNYQVNDNGIGKNLFEDGLAIFALRAKVMFARAMGAIKNSIGRKQVTVTVDDNEIDPYEVFETSKAEILRAMRLTSSSGSLNPLEITDQLQASAYEFFLEGGENVPKTKVEQTDKQSSYSRPDESLDEDLASMTINFTHVPPEMLENARRAEFATVAVINNILFSKKVMDIQEPFDDHMTHLMVNMLMADPKFIIEIKGVIKDHLNLVTGENMSEELAEYADDPAKLVDLLCMEFISNLVAFLPKPDIKSLESQLEALKIKEEEVDKALEYIFSSESTASEMVGEGVNDKMGELKKLAKAAIMRRYMQEQGFGKEAFELINTDGEGALVWDLGKDMQAHASSIAQVVTSMLEKGKRTADAAELTLSKLDAGSDSADTSSDTSFDDDTSTDSTMGGDDFGLDELDGL